MWPSISGSHRRRARGFAVVLVAVLASLHDVAAACPVCFTADDATLDAYYGTAIALTLLPLLLIAGGVATLAYLAHKRDGAPHAPAGTPRA